MMDFFSPLDVLLLQCGLAGVFLTFAQAFVKRCLRPNRKPVDFPLLNVDKVNKKQMLVPTRRIKQMLQKTGKTCIIFYGTQTGTAEKCARRMAKVASTRYNLQCLVADLDDFDYDDLIAFDDNAFAIFVLATYGDGEPSDNAILFEHFLRTLERKNSSKPKQASMKLKYAAFGLGNSSYKHYNSMIRRVDGTLSSCGATRLGDVGLGDDGQKTLEEDFAEWTVKTLETVATHFQVPKLEYSFKADFEITEDNFPVNQDVFLGEPNKLHLRNKIQGPFTQNNPLPAKIVDARELFTSRDRNCLHVEFDVSGTTLNYETGDHLAVWPVNSETEITRFLFVFGLLDRKQTVINIRPHDLSIKIPIPSKTTYEAAARHYLDVGGTVSRALLGLLAKIIVVEPARSNLFRLSSDIAAFHDEVLGRRLTLAQTLSEMTPADAFHSIPFSFILENVAKLQPRYYSISSSALCNRKKISITAIVDSLDSTDPDINFKGVSTNYLFALTSRFSGEKSDAYHLSGPRNKFDTPTSLIHVRRSKFRLPRRPSTPVIMIGPGTGVAPFRAFVQERAFIASSGCEVGRTILFYGCRRRGEDFLYRDEWTSHAKSFVQNKFSLHAAFSRDGDGKKTYVQDLLREQEAELKQLVLHENAHVYVCGDARRMAKDVFRTFSSIVGEEVLVDMKAKERWCEDVW